MIPEIGTSLQTIENKVEPSLTYYIDEVSNRVVGKVDGLQAVLQSVKKLLNTERYAYVIYSAQYGIEVERFIGQDYNFVTADLERTIEATLRMDDRISGITNFLILSSEANDLVVSFTINSIEGLINYSTEVNIV